MSVSGHALLTYWLGPYPLASPVAQIIGVVALETAVPVNPELASLGLLATVVSGGQAVPVLDLGPVLGITQSERTACVLVLKRWSLAVAVTRVGDVLKPHEFAVYPLPEWLATRVSRRGITHAIEADGLRLVVDWDRVPLAHGQSFLLSHQEVAIVS